LKLPKQITVPAEHWFGSAFSINWQSSNAAGRGALVFRSAVLGVYVVVWPAWRDALEVILPETVLRGRRHGMALIWKYRSRDRSLGGRPRITLETRRLTREMARANFVWAPRIHGQLLKLGITVSQATVSRYMPPSRRDRRSRAWRTFIRNHVISLVQSRSFNAHDWVW
jgi:hypothetical protein